MYVYVLRGLKANTEEKSQSGQSGAEWNAQTKRMSQTGGNAVSERCVYICVIIT